MTGADTILVLVFLLAGVHVMLPILVVAVGPQDYDRDL